MVKSNPKYLISPDYKIDYEPQKWQREFHEAEERHRLALCGRQSGKSIAAANECIRVGLRKPGSIIWLIAPSYRLVKRVWSRLKYYLPKQFIISKNEKDLYMTISSDPEKYKETVIEGISASAKTSSAIGEKVDLVIFDEAKEIPNDRIWVDDVRPAFLHTKGRAVIITTPSRDPKHWVNLLFFDIKAKKKADPNYKEWGYWQIPTWETELADQEEIDQIRQDMIKSSPLGEQLFNLNMGAQIIESLGSGIVFTNIDKAAIGHYESPRGQRTIMAIDWGGTKDPNVVLIMDLDTKMIIDMDRYVPGDFEDDCPYEAEFLKTVDMALKWQPERIVSEAQGNGSGPTERLKLAVNPLDVIPYFPSGPVKRKAVQKLARSIEKKELTFPNDPQITQELLMFEGKKTPAGNRSYMARFGYTDDIVDAMTMLWKVVEEQRARWHFSPPPKEDKWDQEEWYEN